MVGPSHQNLLINLSHPNSIILSYLKYESALLVAWKQDLEQRGQKPKKLMEDIKVFLKNIFRGLGSTKQLLLGLIGVGSMMTYLLLRLLEGSIPRLVWAYSVGCFLPGY